MPGGQAWPRPRAAIAREISVGGTGRAATVCWSGGFKKPWQRSADPVGREQAPIQRVRAHKGGPRGLVLSQPLQRTAELIVRRRVGLDPHDRAAELFGGRCGVIRVEPCDADCRQRRRFPFALALPPTALGLGGFLCGGVLFAGLL